MKRRAIDSFSLLFALLLLLSFINAGAAPDPAPASPGQALTGDDIKAMLRDYIDADKLGVGLAVGIVDEQGARVVSHGRLENGTDREVDGDTLFHIGSIAKVFTALLLQDMVERGEMKLDDPVQKYLPAAARMPTYQGKAITLLHLATHTSGLPRDKEGDLYAFLSRCTLHQAPGTHREYSNLGMGLLGHVIALKAGKDYETLIIERICQPLGMNDTRITLTPELKARLAPGHGRPGHRMREYTPTRHETNAQVPSLLGAGSIRSTANDLLKFVAAYAGLTPSPLSPLLQKAQALHPLESGAKQRLAWDGDGSVFEHGGLAGGYQAELAFDVKKRRGVVVLSNCANYGYFVPGVWQSLLAGRSPRPGGVAPLDAQFANRYAGRYQPGLEAGLSTIRCDGKRVWYQWLGVPGQRLRFPSCELFPLSESVFRNEFRDLEARFLPATNGQPVRLVMTSLGPLSGFEGSFELARVSTEVPEPPAPVRVDASTYDGYAGRYRKTFLFGLIRVGPTLSIAHEPDALGSHLVAQVRGLGSEEIFPETETSFLPGSNVTDDFRITFVRNKKGRTKGVVVHWNGKKYRGSRISDRPAKCAVLSPTAGSGRSG